MSKVSIVVPAYNVQKYLDECMASLLGQTLQDIEIICMDDGSSDGTAEKLDEYSAKDSRVKVIHKLNSGYGDSVNKGIAMATGKYVGIVEPDDYVSVDMFKLLFDKAEELDLDFAKGNFANFSGDNGNLNIQLQEVVGREDLYGKVFRPIEYSEIFRGYIINPAGIYKKDFLDRYGILHNTTPGASYQDTGFWFQVMYHSQRACLIKDVVYFYRQDNVQSSINDNRKVYCICDEYDYIRNNVFGEKQPTKTEKMVFTESMFMGYFNTIDRIGIEVKGDFIRKFAEDFNRIQGLDLYDATNLFKEEEEALDKIINNTEEYISSVTRMAEYYKHKLKDSSSAVIYGCGKYGKQIIKNLYSEELKKISGFVVSKLDGQEDNVYGYKVTEIKEYKDRNDEITVLIGVSKQYEDDVRRNLDAHGFKQIIDYCGE